MTDTPTSPVRKLPPQPSTKQLQEYARPMAQKALDTAFRMLTEADNDSVKLGAAKLILAKVMPDLKATELSGELAVDLRNVLRLPSKRPLDAPPETD